jgi:RNA polymerase sigma factor (sigma-70 family)
MATTALDIHGQGVAVQSYQNKVQQLTDVIVRQLARFRRIALRRLGNRRTHGEQNLLLAEMLPDHQPNPEEVCCRRELAERLADATTQLSPTLRNILQLRDLDGLSIRETAHLLGVPGGTVKAQLARGRVRLKEIVR